MVTTVNELTYYIIKNLVHKVLKDIDNFELVSKTEMICDIELPVFGFKDKTSGFKIYRSDFNYRFNKVFVFLTNKVTSHEGKLSTEKQRKEREAKINAINDYLGVTDYYNTWRKEYEQTLISN